jgi:hypothetical protein
MKSILNSMIAALALFSVSAWAADTATCPISGKATDPGVSLNINGKSVGFCCDKCPVALEKKLGVADEGARTCPVSGEAADGKVRMIQATTEAVYFCCGRCQAKYVKEQKVPAVSEEGSAKCPVSGEEADPAQFVVHLGKKVGFCCGRCKSKYVKDNHVVVVDKGPGTCPVSGEPAEKGQVLHVTKAKAVYFCCTDCRKEYVSKEIAAKL